MMTYLILSSVLLWLANTVFVMLRTLIGQEIPRWQWVFLQYSIGAVCSYAVYRLHFYPRYFTSFKKLPTPATRNLFTGNERGFFREPQWTVARRISESVPNGGLLRYYAAFNQERILVTSPKALAEVLVQKVDDYDHPAFMKFAAERVTGKGMQFATGEDHKTQRKHLMPAFSPVHIKTLIPTFWEETTKMIHGIEDEIRQSNNRDHQVFVTDWSIRAALDIIGLAGMGYHFNSLGNPNGEHRELTKVYRKFLSRANPVFPWIGLLMNYIPIDVLRHIPEPRNMALNRAFSDVRERAVKIIEARKEKLAHEETDKSTAGKDIITVALRSGMFSSENLMHHVMTSLVVGHLSTAITFDWVCFELGQRPGMQARLREEIRTKWPGGLTTVDASTIDTLPYLNAVCSETLRFYPPLPFALRVAVRKTTLLGTEIPKGTTIAYCADAINHDKDQWGEDAHLFNPERWMGQGRAGSGGSLSNFAMLTFSAGPKNCIGQWWERAELACLVVAFFGRFEAELANRHTAGVVERAPAMMSREGVYIRLNSVPGW
ncbi:hypothetical protein ONS96_003426 [Cadophora gregata f. sp. sojae]|nr:hypothetical protein ONS96_003426 [Cadophora gregata f. sp. sojae]